MLEVASEFDMRPDYAIPWNDANDLTKGGNLANVKQVCQPFTLRKIRMSKLILTK